MVSLIIKNPDLPSGYEVENTTWFIARDKEFQDIVAVSLEDTNNKFNIQFNVELEFGRKYYAKSRVVYNKGFSNYSNINVFIAKDLNEIELHLYAPTKISRPSITILPAVEEKPIALLNFSGGEFVTKYNIPHQSATYILEDITGKVIWSKINDRANLDNISLPIILEENSAYRLIMAYEGANNNMSQFAIETFVTGKNEIGIIGDLNSVPAGIDLTFTADYADIDIISIDYKLFSEGKYLVDSTTINNFDGVNMKTWSVKGELLLKDINYVLYIRTIDSLGKAKVGYFYFKPYFDLSKTPDDNFFYSNNRVTPFIPNYTAEMFATSSGYRPELPNLELIQSTGADGIVVLNFFKFNAETRKFNFTGRTFNLGNLFGISSGVSMDDFSYTLMKNSMLVLKCTTNDLLISVPYNIISGDINTNLIKTRALSNGLVSKANTQHGIVDINKNEFITFSMEEKRLLTVNSLDLSYSFLNSKVYDRNPEMLAIYKISAELMLIVDISTTGLAAKYDIYNFNLGTYLAEDQDLDTTGIELANGGLATLKVVQLFNGTILCMFKSSTPNNTVYKVLNIKNIVTNNPEDTSSIIWSTVLTTQEIVLNEDTSVTEADLVTDGYNGEIVTNNVVISDSADENAVSISGIYKFDYLMLNNSLINQGVYSLLRSGAVLQLSANQGLIYE